MKRLSILLLLLPMLLGLSCGKKKPQSQSPPVAQVSEDILRQDAFRSTFTDEEWNAMDSAQRKKYVEDWVNLTLLAQEADALGISKEPEVRQKLDYASKKVKANALIARRLADIKISEDELFNYYRIHQADFTGKMLEYNVQRIYLKDQPSATALLERLKTGLDFNEAVRTSSRENLREQLGNMGFVSPADTLFWQQARSLKDGEFGMFAADGGWYLIRHTGTREGEQDAGFEEFRTEIRERILSERQRQVYDELLRELKAKNNEIYYY